MIMHFRKQRWLYQVGSIILIALLSAVFLTDTIQSKQNELNGNSPLAVEQATPLDERTWQIPAEGTITREFGSVVKGSHVQSESYTGIAIANKEGTEVVAASAGVVIFAAYTPENGYHIVIDHGQDWITTYSHLQAIQVQEQQQVEMGETIGTMGSTGRSTGSHLKFEVLHDGKALDPKSIFSTEIKSDSDPIFPIHFPVRDTYEVITSFGMSIGKDGQKMFHPGIDITSSDHTSIYAIAGGTVLYAQYDPEYGNYVTIDHGMGWKSNYSHLAEITVSEGDWISKGDHIGWMGSTGKTTGTHLHFELYRGNLAVDPLDYFTNENDKNTLRGLTWEEIIEHSVLQRKAY